MPGDNDAPLVASLRHRKLEPSVSVTPAQADSALSRVMQYYDLGIYADALQDLGLTGYKKAEILADIALDEDQKPGSRMRALKELDILLDRNVEASGYKRHSKAEATVPGLGSVTVSLTAISESRRVADMFKQGLGKDSLPLYAEDISKHTLCTDELDATIANPERLTKETPSDSDGKEKVEGAAPSNGNDQTIGGLTGANEDSDGPSVVGGSGGRADDPPAAQGVATPPTNVFCQSIGSTTEGDRRRHIGHWPPSAFVPGGGVTGVPRGADPFTYGQESCVSYEEARRLAKCAVNEGIARSECSPENARRIEAETNEALHKAEREREDRTRGRGITTRRVGPIPMFEIVQGGRTEADQVLGSDGSESR